MGRASPMVKWAAIAIACSTSASVIIWREWKGSRIETMVGMDATSVRDFLGEPVISWPHDFKCVKGWDCAACASREADPTLEVLEYPSLFLAHYLVFDRRGVVVDHFACGS